MPDHPPALNTLCVCGETYADHLFTDTDPAGWCPLTGCRQFEAAQDVDGDGGAADAADDPEWRNYLPFPHTLDSFTARVNALMNQAADDAIDGLYARHGDDLYATPDTRTLEADPSFMDMVRDAEAWAADNDDAWGDI